MFRNGWAAVGDEIIDTPLHYLIQVQHQLACRPDALHGWLIACVGGNRLYRTKIERHPGSIAAIERAVVDFWVSIREERAPTPDFQADAAAVAALYAHAGVATADLSANNRLPELCAAYQRAGADEKAAKGAKAAAKAEIFREIGDAAKALCSDGYTVSAGMVAGAEVAYSRKAYRAFAVNKTAGSTMPQEEIDV